MNTYLYPTFITFNLYNMFMFSGATEDFSLAQAKLPSGNRGVRDLNTGLELPKLKAYQASLTPLIHH